MAPKRATRSNIAPETTNTTSVTNAQLQAMINQGVTAALAARDANTNGVDSHNSGTGARRNERATRECTYPDFMKCQPLNFKGTEGVVELTQWIEKMETVFRISNYVTPPDITSAATHFWGCYKMFLTRTENDRGVNTFSPKGRLFFSPKGRLFRVEYAIKAIKLGSIAIGLKIKESVVLAVEKHITSPLLIPKAGLISSGVPTVQPYVDLEALQSKRMMAGHLFDIQKTCSFR
ncbi:alkaline ceramidase-like protein [Tanacetum coccineum]